jgi:hypothetical protein
MFFIRCHLTPLFRKLWQFRIQTSLWMVNCSPFWPTRNTMSSKNFKIK